MSLSARSGSYQVLLYWLEEADGKDCRIWGTAGFTNGELESLWLQVLAEEADGKLLLYDRSDPRLLKLHERWLCEVVERSPVGAGLAEVQHQRRLA